VPGTLGRPGVARVVRGVSLASGRLPVGRRGAEVRRGALGIQNLHAIEVREMVRGFGGDRHRAMAIRGLLRDHDIQVDVVQRADFLAAQVVNL